MLGIRQNQAIRYKINAPFITQMAAMLILVDFQKRLRMFWSIGTQIENIRALCNIEIVLIKYSTYNYDSNHLME